MGAAGLAIADPARAARRRGKILVMVKSGNGECVGVLESRGDGLSC